MQYFGRYQGFRGRMVTLPGWAKWVLGVVSLPGLVLMGLSIAAFLVSVLALLVLVVPTWWLLKAMGGRGPEPEAREDPAPVADSPGRKAVEATVIEE